jgi:hypothetical protein
LIDTTDMLDSSVEGENANDLAFNDQLASVQTRHVGCRKTGRLVVADENACAGAAGFAALAAWSCGADFTAESLRTSGADWALQSALAPQALGPGLATVALRPHWTGRSSIARGTLRARLPAFARSASGPDNRADYLFAAVREPLHQTTDRINRRADDRPPGKTIAPVSPSITARPLDAGLATWPGFSDISALTLWASLAGFTTITLRAVRANVTLWADLAPNTLFTALTLWARFTAFASRPGFTLRTGGAGFAPWPSFALGALWSSVSLRADLPQLPIGASFAHLTPDALRPSRSGFAARANGADCTGLPAIPLRAGLTTRPNFAICAAFAINAGIAALPRLTLFAALALRPDKPTFAARPDFAAFTLWATLATRPVVTIDARQPILAIAAGLTVPPVTRQRARFDRNKSARNILDAAKKPHQRAVRLLRRLGHGKGTNLRIRHVQIPGESR